MSRAPGRRVLPSSCGKPLHPCARRSTARLPQLFDRPRAGQTFAAAMRKGAWQMQSHAYGRRIASEAAARLSLHSCCRPCSDPASSEFHLLTLPLPLMLPFRVAPRVTPAAKPVPSQQSSVRWRGCRLRCALTRRRRHDSVGEGGNARPCIGEGGAANAPPMPTARSPSLRSSNSAPQSSPPLPSFSELAGGGGYARALPR